MSHRDSVSVDSWCCFWCLVASLLVCRSGTVLPIFLSSGNFFETPFVFPFGFAVRLVDRFCTRLCLFVLIVGAGLPLLGYVL